MRLAAIFSEHMVLQRDKEIRIFGETENAAVICADIDGVTSREEAAGGHFVLTLPAHAAGGPFTLTITESDPENGAVRDEKKIGDIYFGEVWIDNGQSNIEFEIRNARGGAKELEEADFTLIRTFKCIKTPVIDETVLENEKYQEWKLCRKGAFFEMSGVAWYFAKKLYEELKCPIGIVDCYQGGTSISCWLSEERLGKYPEGRIYQEIFAEAVKGQTEEEYNRKLLDYNRLVEEYLERERIAKAKNPDITPEELSAEAGDYPWPPPQGLTSAFRPSGLYHTMLERIAPFASRGIIYYQGEEDSGKASGYRVLLSELMDEFRTDFLDDKLPVVILQLPMFISRNTEDMRDWAYLREAQAEAVSETEGAMLIPLIDCGEFDNVHPVDKKTPGERTAGEVLHKIYGNPAGAPHMELDRAEKQEDGSVVLSFRNTCGELKNNPKGNELIDLRKELVRPDEDHIFGFEVMITPEEWIVPDVEIEGEKVLLTARDDISGVRYGFFNYGKVSLYNGKGYPLAPFRRMV
ncbi:MAG: hypothetical protein IKQ49_04965 [Eubacterium sp.]|nr:hypothetical protein [Eubacterium sp.]